MKKLLILHTGGTISMRENQQTGRVSPTDSNPLTEAIFNLSEQSHIIQESLFHLPSPHITIQHMQKLNERIQTAITEGFHAVVITHGTDTLEETAYYLDLTVGTTIPVVITGAMRSSNEMGADGLLNLQNAILVALDPQTKGKGVTVVMNDEIHTAKYVTKTHTTNVATFQTPTFGPIGLISKNQVLYFQTLIATECFPIQSLSKQNVYVIKAFAGMDSFLFESINTPHTDGVIIEALGAGNLPPQSVPGVKALIENNIPVVLVSRAFNGVTQDVYDYVGGGKQLKDLGVIFTTGLSGQKARIKLIALLNTTLDQPLENYFNHV